MFSPRRDGPLTKVAANYFLAGWNAAKGYAQQAVGDVLDGLPDDANTCWREVADAVIAQIGAIDGHSPQPVTVCVSDREDIAAVVKQIVNALGK